MTDESSPELAAPAPCGSCAEIPVSGGAPALGKQLVALTGGLLAWWLAYGNLKPLASWTAFHLMGLDPGALAATRKPGHLEVHDPAHTTQQQCKSVRGHFVQAIMRTVSDHDPRGGGGIVVHVVVTDADVAHYSQRRRPLQELAGNRLVRWREQALDAWRDGRELLRGHLAPSLA